MVQFADILAYEASVKGGLRPSDHVAELLKYYDGLIRASRQQKRPYQGGGGGGGGRRGDRHGRGQHDGRRHGGHGGGRVDRHGGRDRRDRGRRGFRDDLPASRGGSNSFSGRETSWRDKAADSGGWERSEKGGRRARAKARREAAAERADRAADAAGFTVTRLQHMESDDEVILNKVRVAMNKLSETNQARIQMEVLAAMQDVPADPSAKLAQDCFNSIVELCYSNRYFVDQYAGIFAYILKQNRTMAAIWARWTARESEREAAVTGIPRGARYIDGEEDYDAFCREVKQHEQYATYLLLLERLSSGDDPDRVPAAYVAGELERLFALTLERFKEERGTANNYVSNVLCKMWCDVLANVSRRAGVWEDYLARWREFMGGDLSGYTAFPRKSRFAFEALLSNSACGRTSLR